MLVSLTVVKFFPLLFRFDAPYVAEVNSYAATHYPQVHYPGTDQATPALGQPAFAYPSVQQP